MSTHHDLLARADGACELCTSTTEPAPFELSHAPGTGAEAAVLLCATCRAGLPDAEADDAPDASHWRCLTTSMWSEVPAVQALAFRQLSSLAALEPWAAELLDQLYLEDDLRAWAEAGLPAASAEGEPAVVHRDSNGVVLETGDTVTLIKDLDVKGAGFTAKRGTAVRGIALVDDNAEHIEGRVNGTRIVILTQFVRKQK
ncbi:MAG: PhnA domain-containing protein [Planctomycetota bacterium]|nr:PhnA domain-containing protein [Planctomycetota bacterium]